MKIHLTNGCIYDIPKGTRYANISIAFTEIELQTCREPARYLRREIAIENSKKKLVGFTYIGDEEINKDDIQIELLWFIDIRDLNKCKMSYGDINE